jgi:hypothetical protein
MSDSQLKRHFNNPDAFVSILLILFVDQFDDDAITWSPETIRRELEERIGDVPDDAFNKLMAGITLVTTDLFTTSLPHFITLTNITADDDLRTEEAAIADPYECAAAIAEYGLLTGTEVYQEPESFSPEIRHYIGASLTEFGFGKTPSSLAMGVRPPADPSLFQDDPDFYAAVNELQSSQADSVDKTVEDRMSEILAQLRTLSLTVGSTAWLSAKEQNVTDSRNPTAR